MTHMGRGWKIVMFVVLGVAAVFLFGTITKELWNWLVPSLFGGPVLTFWQALGLLFLSRLLFGGFSKGRGDWGQKKRAWGYYWSEKWKHMTPDDRERFKQKMREKWCAPAKQTPDENSGVSNG